MVRAFSVSLNSTSYIHSRMRSIPEGAGMNAQEIRESKKCVSHQILSDAMESLPIIRYAVNRDYLSPLQQSEGII